jgi:hypothetical protein
MAIAIEDALSNTRAMLDLQRAELLTSGDAANASRLHDVEFLLVILDTAPALFDATRGIDDMDDVTRHAVERINLALARYEKKNVPKKEEGETNGSESL